MARSSSRFLTLLISLVVVLLVLAATHSLWLAALGRALVHDEGPEHADIALVLAGDFYGKRILRAAELVKQGYVPKILVSGPHMMFGHYECDLAIPFAVEHGYPQEWFIRAPNESHSTQDEATALLPDLRRLGVHRFLLVTSDYHTARAARIYRALSHDFDIRVVAAPDQYFTADGWWHSREGQKIVFMEWTKTVATAVGL